MDETYEWGLTPEILERLAQPFPKEAHEIKRVKNAEITFVSWHWYVQRLNEVVPNWSMGLPTLQEIGGKLIVGIPLTINGVTRINYGDEGVEVDAYGTSMTNAYAQALKRTAALFGLGLYLYDDKARAEATRQPTKAEQKKARENARTWDPEDDQSRAVTIAVDRKRWTEMVAWLGEVTNNYYRAEQHVLNALALGDFYVVDEDNAKAALAYLVNRVREKQEA